MSIMFEHRRMFWLANIEWVPLFGASLSLSSLTSEQHPKTSQASLSVSIDAFDNKARPQFNPCLYLPLSFLVDMTLSCHVVSGLQAHMLSVVYPRLWVPGVLTHARKGRTLRTMPVSVSPSRNLTPAYSGHELHNHTATYNTYSCTIQLTKTVAACSQTYRVSLSHMSRFLEALWCLLHTWWL